MAFLTVRCPQKEAEPRYHVSVVHGTEAEAWQLVLARKMESTMRAESLRRMAEEMALLKRSAVTADVKEFFAARERECLDEAEEQERCPPEGDQPAPIRQISGDTSHPQE